jgi:hypothetical protein
MKTICTIVSWPIHVDTVTLAKSIRRRITNNNAPEEFGLTKIYRLCQAAMNAPAAMWAGLWVARSEVSERPLADTSYDEVPPEQIRRMNEHARSAFASGNWVTERREP